MNGIDISHHQGNIDLSVVPADFVICKATQGTSHVDDRFISYMRQLEGKLTGVYHYCSQGGAINEAEHFLKTVKDYIGKSILVLDWEGEQNPNFGNPEYALAWLRYVEQKTGVKPFIYMSKSVCRQYSKQWDSSFPLWCAQYKNQNPTGYQENPWTDSKGFGAWSGCQILQYSSKGRLEGYPKNLDLDKAYITAEQWLLYAQGNYKEPVLNARPTLKKGDKNEYVLAWQYYLNLLGYNLVPDGIFGIKTEDAVKDYQSKRGLKPDGIIGPLTWNTVGK